MSANREHLTKLVATRIMPSNFKPGTGEWQFWMRVARRAIKAIDSSGDYRVTRRRRGEIVYFRWDDVSQELVEDRTLGMNNWSQICRPVKKRR